MGIKLSKAMGISGAAPAFAIDRGSALTRPIDLHAIPPRLVVRAAAPRRTKIWEFNTNLHCSIIGTCLSTGELRQVLRKLGMAAQDHTDHELHGIAVSLAGRHDNPARALHKALDQRHKLPVSQFDKADSLDGLRAMWRDAVRRGDIPGAYWATLTHPLSNQALVREAFGEVHMLSHLVGSANRADLRRLCQLEADKAALEDKLQRQQQALHTAVVTRDRQIEALRQALAERIIAEPAAVSDDNAVLRDLVADLERRLSAAERRGAGLQERLERAQALAVREQAARLAAETDHAAMRRELELLEAPQDAVETPASRLDGVTLLYVGGRPNQLAPMRTAVERLGATLLHHDGGIENHPNLLPGLASRSDIILFPVDCISHDAANAVKSACRHGGKRFVPLRSASVTSLLAALRGPIMHQAAGCAD
jgi:hypothetical protein